MHFDVVVVGAGPIGLALACNLSEIGLTVAVIERQHESSLHSPQDDGREIAVGYHARQCLQHLGAWSRISPGEISPIREAHVSNMASVHNLRIQAGDNAADGCLGHLVSNRSIRKALYACASEQHCVTLITNQTVDRIETKTRYSSVHLSQQPPVSATLLVAADSRMSMLRSMMGIPAQVKHIQRSMLLCRLSHDKPHGQVASEWFDRDQTIAILPLNGRCSSAVITLEKREVNRLLLLDIPEFEAEMTTRYQKRLGGFHLIGNRYAYPLVTAYAERFVGNRFALVGDAAVGMHPMTALGFNLGMHSQHLLIGEIRKALSTGMDYSSPGPLLAYHRAFQQLSWPLYTGTNFVASLFQDTRLPARVARESIIRSVDKLAFLKREIANVVGTNYSISRTTRASTLLESIACRRLPS